MTVTLANTKSPKMGYDAGARIVSADTATIITGETKKGCESTADMINVTALSKV